MKSFKNMMLVSVALLSTQLCPVFAAPAAQAQAPAVKAGQAQDWQDFHSVNGQCTLKFPALPEHISENMSVPEEGYELKYDAYISNLEKKSVFLLLIAQYPDFVDQSLAQVSLEGFLNGILANNPGNQLLFADLLLVSGYEALDFFIRTGAMYFKGRAIMVKNKLYLMAMECEIQHYDEDRFNYFVNSFQLGK